jgi:hypothetical protein
MRENVRIVSALTLWLEVPADPKCSVVEKDGHFYAAAYVQRGGMRTGFEYFKAFEQDAKDFAGGARTRLPAHAGAGR